MKNKEYSISLAGKEVKAIFSDLVEQANGSVMLSCDNTVVLATACMSRSGRDNPGYFNLQVEYQEKNYAAGQILGSRFTRREGRPSTHAVLSARVIDRTLRPLFEHHIRNAVQVVITVLSIGDYSPTILGINAASLALATSDIPWGGPVGAVKLSRDDGETGFLLNKRSYIDNKAPSFELIVCGKEGTVNMIEAGLNQVEEDEIGLAIDSAMESVKTFEDWQKSIVAEIGVKKYVIDKPETPSDVKDLFSRTMEEKIKSELFGDDCKHKLRVFEDEWDAIVDEIYPGDTAEGMETRKLAAYYFHEMIDKIIHDAAIYDDKRADLRKMNEVRKIYAKCGGIAPMIHGTGIFYRGGTHIFSALTLAGPDDVLTEDGMEVQGDKTFYHHYNFPPYSAGEVGRFTGFNRRAIGHGMLAEKALRPVLPSNDDFPYTIRLVSESMASNGSTSQASICGSSLAMMDGGVPISGHVAGIAMGLMMEGDKYKVLTDIQGPEDHHGDMDFKVAGTRRGVTAIQLDIKTAGINPSILKEALLAASEARNSILDVMEAEIMEPRKELSPYAPKILKIKLPQDKIGMVIGSQGKTIQDIQEKTDTVINIEDDGTTFITGVGNGSKRALDMIELMTREWVVGDKVEGKVVKVLDKVGAIVALSDYVDGLVHISQLASFRVEKVEDVVKVGMSIPVTVIAVDKEKDRISLSVKKDNPDFFKKDKNSAQ